MLRVNLDRSSPGAACPTSLGFLGGFFLSYVFPGDGFGGRSTTMHERRLVGGFLQGGVAGKNQGVRENFSRLTRWWNWINSPYECCEPVGRGYDWN